MVVFRLDGPFGLSKIKMTIFVFLHIFLTVLSKIFCKNPLTLRGNRTIFILLALEVIEC